MGDLGMGAFAAYLMHNRSAVELFSKGKAPLIHCASLAIFSLALFIHNRLLSDGDTATFGRLLLSVMFAQLIFCQANESTGHWGLSRFKGLTQFGKYTYAFYCLHLFVIMIFQKFNARFPDVPRGAMLFYGELLAIFVGTTIVSILSYRYYEGYFLKIKNQL
jgi:peptidoglycan/LPS O-acetylase OafA/YrhL